MDLCQYQFEFATRSPSASLRIARRTQTDTTVYNEAFSQSAWRNGQSVKFIHTVFSINAMPYAIRAMLYARGNESPRPNVSIVCVCQCVSVAIWFAPSTAALAAVQIYSDFQNFVPFEAN